MMIFDTRVAEVLFIRQPFVRNWKGHCNSRIQRNLLLWHFHSSLTYWLVEWMSCFHFTLLSAFLSLHRFRKKLLLQSRAPQPNIPLLGQQMSALAKMRGRFLFINPCDRENCSVNGTKTGSRDDDVVWKLPLHLHLHHKTLDWMRTIRRNYTTTCIHKECV